MKLQDGAEGKHISRDNYRLMKFSAFDILWYNLEISLQLMYYLLS